MSPEMHVVPRRDQPVFVCRQFRQGWSNGRAKSRATRNAVPDSTHFAGLPRGRALSQACGIWSLERKTYIQSLETSHRLAAGDSENVSCWIPMMGIRASASCDDVHVHPYSPSSFSDPSWSVTIHVNDAPNGDWVATVADEINDPIGSGSMDHID